jgi:NAD(P)-dependent dehydrogenase (short-subunit alcohol dehydrogenase family)
VNLKSVFLCTQAVLPMMRSNGWGRIVNISSGGTGAIGPHYNASKAGIEGLTRGYAARLVKEGITINAVAPSLIETDVIKGQHNLIGRIPLGRFGKAAAFAWRPPCPIASFRPAGKIRSYRNDRRILSLMIEVNRRIYMDEQWGLKKPEFEQASALIGKVIATAAESVD